MQYTIRGIPAALDRALREKARSEHKSLNETALEALEQGLGFDNGILARRDVSDIAGTWKKDPVFDEVIREQDRIDKSLWT